MKNFICGAMYATGLIMFGKGMYELGKSHALQVVATRLTKLAEDIKKQADEKSKQEDA